jgi:sigma-B regulation protein RsbU (phosphoserine phosphatase)
MPNAVASHLDWLRHTASRLGDALGWPITWTDASEPSEHADKACCHVEVRDDVQTVGRLTLEWPDDPQLDSAFHSVHEVAELFAGVLSRLVAATKTLDVRRQDVSTLVEVGKTVARTNDLQSALAHLMRAAAQLSGLWSGAFFLLDPRESRWRLRATHQLPANAVPFPRRLMDPGVPDAKAQRNGSVVLERMNPRDSAWLPAGMSVGLCVPIIADSCPIGSLWCFDRRQRRLGSWEVEVLQSAAVQIASVLERTVLIKESAEQQQLKSDLRFVSRKLPVGWLQRPPADWGLDIAVRSATVTEVGGDLCDVIPLGNRRTLIAVGDAVGHGIPAAMLASVARGALRALLAETPACAVTTEGLMTGLNRALYAVTRSEQFVTLLLAIVDSQSRTLTYANAGHPPPLLLRDGEWLSLTSHGLFLGVSPAAKYPSTTCELAEGDVLVGFTDGVTETINPSREVFRRQGIQETIRTATDATANAIAEMIWQRLEAHDPGRPLRDDRTLLVLKFLGGD